jgi:WbqC-like protein
MNLSSSEHRGDSAAKRIAIVQSNYIPWKGYFDLIASVDEFVLYDDAQYTKRDWRNRNRIKTSQGLVWLTIPVLVRGRFDQRIRDAVAADSRWREKHWRTVRASYRKAPFFAHYESTLEALFAGAQDDRLSAINLHFLSGLCRQLNIPTQLTRSMDYTLDHERTARLVSICRQAGASEYVSGPAARSYLDERQFRDAGITLIYADYLGYPEYPQLYPPFEHRVSVIDLLVHTGPDASRFMLAGGRQIGCRTGAPAPAWTART